MMVGSRLETGAFLTLTEDFIMLAGIRTLWLSMGKLSSCFRKYMAFY